MHKQLRNLPLDVIDRCLKSLCEQMAELELSYLMGKIETPTYKLRRLNIDTEIIYYKHCRKLSERILNG